MTELLEQHGAWVLFGGVLAERTRIAVSGIAATGRGGRVGGDRSPLLVRALIAALSATSWRISSGFSLAGAAGPSGADYVGWIWRCWPGADGDDGAAGREDFFLSMALQSSLLRPRFPLSTIAPPLAA